MARIELEFVERQGGWFRIAVDGEPINLNPLVNAPLDCVVSIPMDAIPDGAKIGDRFPVMMRLPKKRMTKKKGGPDNGELLSEK